MRANNNMKAASSGVLSSVLFCTSCTLATNRNIQLHGRLDGTDVSWEATEPECVTEYCMRYVGMYFLCPTHLVEFCVCISEIWV